MSEDRAEHRRWVLILGALTALGPLAIDAYLPSLPTIQRALQAEGGAAQLTLSAYFVGLALGQLFWGPAADRMGRKKPLLIGLGLYALGSLACALAPRIEALIAARTLQALGGSAGVVVVRAIVRDRWAGRQGAQVMSWIVLVMGAAPILAPSLGGALLRLGSWRGIFVVLTVAGLLMLLAVAKLLPETSGGERVAEPMLGAARRVLADRRFVSYGLSAGFSSAGMFAYIAGSPFLFIEMLGIDPSLYAVIFGLNASGFVLASQLNRRLLAVRDHTSVALAAAAITTLFTTGFGAIAWAGPSSLVLLCVVVFGYVASLGFAGANTTAAALERQAERAGLASAVMGATQFLLSAAASAVVGAFSDGTARPMAIAMLVCAAGSLLGVLVGRTTNAELEAPAAA